LQEDGHSQFVAFYSDSLGQRRDEAVLHHDSGMKGNVLLTTMNHKHVKKAYDIGFAYSDDQLSHSILRSTLRNFSTERGEHIEFNDVSVNQQGDSASCGIYALENANIINQMLNDGQVNLNTLRHLIENNVIDTNLLRQQYNQEIMNEQQSVENNPPEEAKETATETSHSQQPLEETELERAISSWQTNNDLSTLKHLLISVLLNDHSFNSPAVKEIWKGIKKLNTMKGTEKDLKDLFSYVIDLIEEQDDPRSHIIANLPPADFLEDVLKKGESILTLNSVITLKLWLMHIFNSTDPIFTIRQFFESGGNNKILKSTFGEGIPRPETGTFIDTNMNEDFIRDIRYGYVLGLIFHNNNDVQAAQRALERSLEWTLQAQNNEEYLSRRGLRALPDLLHIRSAIRLTLAQVRQDVGDESGALSLLAQSASDELLCPSVFGSHDDGYREYLRLVTLNPGFSARELKWILDLGHAIPAYSLT